MRGWLVLTVLALAGCNENEGWNPNYLATDSPYGLYRVAREAALVGPADVPDVIPVARPFYAPVPVTVEDRTVLVLPPVVVVVPPEADEQP